jgi:hypothetical protein
MAVEDVEVIGGWLVDCAERERGMEKEGAMNRAPTAFGKVKIGKWKDEERKERGHDVSCPYE